MHVVKHLVNGVIWWDINRWRVVSVTTSMCVWQGISSRGHEWTLLVPVVLWYLWSATSHQGT